MSKPKKIPTHLSHKPIVIVNDYDRIDGKFKNDTDVVGLSVGQAQYDGVDISAKKWRFIESAGRWSRQSEELPLHRVFDLAILSVASFMIDTKTKYSKTSLREEAINEPQLRAIDAYLKNNKREIEARLKSLQNVIDEYFKYQ